jgi:photosystem II stability/assembly factor-like uncharacterized protein
MMKKALAIFSLNFLFCMLGPIKASVDKQAIFWSSIGPYGGNITGIASSPDSPEVLYAVANSDYGQVFCSQDGGANWVRKAGFNSTLFDVAVDPQNSKIIYVLGYDSLYKSNDEAESFTAYKLGKDCYGNNGRIAIDPVNPNTIYIAGNHRFNPPLYSSYIALFKSIDGGINWTTTDFKTFTTFGLGFGIDIVVSEKLPNALYFCGTFNYGNSLYNYCRVYKSANGGNTWEELTNSNVMGFSRPYGLCVDQKNWSRVFIATNKGVLRSTDGGKTWAWQSSIGLFGAGALALNPSNNRILYAGCHDTKEIRYRFFKSRDSGLTWQGLNNGVYGKTNRILFNKGKIFMATSAGIFCSKNGGATFSSSHKGIAGALISGLALLERSADFLGAAVRGYGLFKTRDGGKTWTKCSDFFESEALVGLAAHPTSASIFYALTESYLYDDLAKLYRTNNGGIQWTSVLLDYGESVSAGVKTPGLVVVPGQINLLKNDQYLVLGFHWTVDDGVKWTHVFLSGQIQGVGLVAAIDPANEDILYLGATVGQKPCVYRLQKTGATWFYTELASPVVGQPRSIAIDPKVTNTIYVGTREGAWKSSDSGSTWSKMNLKSADCLAIHPLNTKEIFAGCQKGIYYSNNGGVNWTDISGDMAVKAVTGIAIHAPSRTVYASTWGGGIYKRKF